MLIQHQKERGVFVALDERNQPVGRLYYEPGPEGNLRAVRTIVSRAHRGKGIGRALVEALVAFARQQKKRIIPECGFVSALFQKQPAEWADVIQGA